MILPVNFAILGGLFGFVRAKFTYLTVQIKTEYNMITLHPKGF